MFGVFLVFTCFIVFYDVLLCKKTGFILAAAINGKHSAC